MTTKKELIDSIAERTGVKKSGAERLKSADLRSKFGCIELLAVIRRLTNQGETT